MGKIFTLGGGTSSGTAPSGGTTTDASLLTSGILPDARLSTNVTKEGTTFNAANKLVKLDANAKLPAVDGSALTNLPGLTDDYYHQVTVATYADALTAATGTSRKLITVTADEKNNGRTNKYYYDGSAGVLTQQGLPIRYTVTANGTQPNTVAGINAGISLNPQPYVSGTYGNITSAQANTMYGFEAGKVLDHGSENTLVGFNAGTSLAAGTGDPLQVAALNTFIGAYAGGNTTIGYANTFIGQKAGSSNTVGNHSVYIGKSAGTDNVGTGNNVMIGGGNCGSFTASANTCVFIGYGAGQNMTGNANIMIGARGGSAANAGSSNTVVGSGAANAFTSAAQNAIFGYRSGLGLTSGGNNTLLGYRCGEALTSGQHNVFVGAEQGQGITTGFGNILLGNYAGNGISATLANTFIAGGDNNNSKILNVYFGKGPKALVPEAYTIRGTENLTTNGNGSDINMVGGLGNGTGVAGKVSITKLAIPVTTLLATPENNVLENDGTNLYITIGGVRKQLS